MPPEYVHEFVYILPGTIYTDMLVLFGLPMLIAMVFYVACPTITRGLVNLHGLFKRGGSHAIARLQGDIPVSLLFKRLFLVSLLSFSIAATLIGYTGWDVFRFVKIKPIDSTIIYLNSTEGLFLATFFFVPVSFLLFLPLWCIEDSGIISYKTFKGKRRTPDIEGVQAIYENILKGYASVSTLITLAQTVYEGFTKVPLKDPAILTPIILLLTPFLTAGLIALPVFFYESRIEKIREKISEKLQQYNLSTIDIPEASDLAYIGVK
ncbi:MAG: hypothetical protein Q6353_004285 [Candidatus Sigynarchaeum springense]